MHVIVKHILFLRTCPHTSIILTCYEQMIHALQHACIHATPNTQYTPLQHHLLLPPPVPPPPAPSLRPLPPPSPPAASPLRTSLSGSTTVKSVRPTTLAHRAAACFWPVCFFVCRVCVAGSIQGAVGSLGVENGLFCEYDSNRRVQGYLVEHGQEPLTIFAQRALGGGNQQTRLRPPTGHLTPCDTQPSHGTFR
jgi:hypothetical protein